ncbi:hypothetical protein [Streptomyces bottropensis]|uniref:hypothetical protein n=1 Tax=Streptomyces bottropensis TaxID=42235 RepID=UPI0036C5FC36
MHGTGIAQRVVRGVVQSLRVVEQVDETDTGWESVDKIVGVEYADAVAVALDGGFESHDHIPDCGCYGVAGGY